MFFLQGAPREGADRPLGPWGRWWQAVTGHFCFTVCAGLLLAFSLIPGLLCVYGLLRTGALVFVLGGILTGTLAGPVLTAVQRAAWELQFGMPCYLYRSFCHWLRTGFRQGAALGMLYAGLWALVLSPVGLTLLGGPPMPGWLVPCLGLGALALVISGGYAFYQAARWQLGTGALLVNSLLLAFAAGWRTLAAAVLWLALPAGLVLCYPVVLPLSVVTGLPVLLAISAQSVFAPAVDELMKEQA